MSRPVVLGEPWDTTNAPPWDGTGVPFPVDASGWPQIPGGAPQTSFTATPDPAPMDVGITCTLTWTDIENPPPPYATLRWLNLTTGFGGGQSMSPGEPGIWTEVLDLTDPVDFHVGDVIELYGGTDSADPSNKVQVTVAEAVNPPNNATGATEGHPGFFTPEGCDIPANVAELNSLGVVATPSTRWTDYSWVIVGTSTHSSWNGTTWVVGDALPPADEEAEAQTPSPSWTVPRLDAWAEAHADIAPDYPTKGSKPEKLAYIRSVIGDD
jgi:hypothetical protein